MFSYLNVCYLGTDYPPLEVLQGGLDHGHLLHMHYAMSYLMFFF